jgi:Zn finger protein HypA/HybF involved in hydrogenase expression
MAWLDRTCIDCGESFQGGPRSWRCPSCRIERDHVTTADYRARKRQGAVRSLGSTDICERCGNQYEVKAGLQRFCEDCQRAHALEKDRELGLKYYESKKDEINPARNERRREEWKTLSRVEKARRKGRLPHSAPPRS